MKKTITLAALQLAEKRSLTRKCKRVHLPTNENGLYNTDVGRISELLGERRRLPRSFETDEAAFISPGNDCHRSGREPMMTIGVSNVHSVDLDYRSETPRKIIYRTISDVLSSGF